MDASELAVVVSVVVSVYSDEDDSSVCAAVAADACAAAMIAAKFVCAFVGGAVETGTASSLVSDEKTDSEEPELSEEAEEAGAGAEAEARVATTGAFRVIVNPVSVRDTSRFELLTTSSASASVAVGPSVAGTAGSRAPFRAGTVTSAVLSPSNVPTA